MTAEWNKSTHGMLHPKRKEFVHQRTSHVARMLSQALPLNKEVVYTIRELAEAAGLTLPIAGDTKQFFAEHDLLATRWETTNQGRRSHWTLMVDLPTMYKFIDEWFATHNGLGIHNPSRERKAIAPAPAIIPDETTEPERVTITEREEEETKAIAGPEPTKPTEVLRPLRKADDAEALIAAARQYVDRARQLDAKIKELEAIGLHVDHELIHQAVSWETDERLELVALLLPYITRLENTNSRLAGENTETRALRQQVIEKDRQLSRQREHIERLVRERTERTDRSEFAEMH
jgi:hypothetical protein